MPRQPALLLLLGMTCAQGQDQAAPPVADDVPTITVIGGAAEDARRRQQDSDTATDVIGADGSGRMTDQNLGRALQRVPGLGVQRDQGEGRRVIIRGLDPGLSTVTIDGQRVGGGGDSGRSVGLDTISARLVKAVEVSKALRPDMDADAVGGNIEIETRSAFDIGERSLSLDSGARYDSLSRRYSPDAALTYTDLFAPGGGTDTLGLALSLSGYERHFHGDSIATGGNWTAADAQAVRGLERGEQRDDIGRRQRLGLVANFDYRPGKNIEAYLRTLYGAVEDRELRRDNRYYFDEGVAVTLDASGGRFDDASLEKRHSERSRLQRTLALSLGAAQQLNAWQLDYGLSHALGRETDLGDELSGRARAEGLDLAYGSGERPRLSVLGDAGQSAQDFAFVEMDRESVRNQEREWAIAFDADRLLSLHARSPAELQMGWKSRLRQRRNDDQRLIYDGFDRRYDLAEAAGAEALRYTLPGEFGAYAGAGAFRALFSNNRERFDLAEERSRVASAADDFLIDEDVHAAYVQVNQPLGERWNLLAGLRVEHTDYAARGTSVRLDQESGDGDIAELQAFDGRNRYTDWFPGLHLLFRPHPVHNLRAALTRSIARPGARDASPRQEIEIERRGERFDRQARIGNPALRALASTNLDLRWEMFPEAWGIEALSLGLYYKDIADFFVEVDIAGTPPFEDFDRALTTVNGPSATLLGLELEFAQALDLLPAPLDGLSWRASYTRSASRSRLPGRSGRLPLPDQSDHLANLGLGWARGAVELELSAGYRSAFFTEAGDPANPEFDRYEDARWQVDLSGQWRLNAATQLYFKADNLGDSADYEYVGDRRYNAEYERWGSTYELGLKLDL